MAAIINIRTVSVPSVGKLPLAQNPGKFTPSGEKREHKPGRLATDGGYLSTSTPAKLELNINVLSGIDMQALNAIRDEDVTVRLEDGQVHMMSQAFAEDTPGVGDGDSNLVLIANVSSRIA